MQAQHIAYTYARGHGIRLEILNRFINHNWTALDLSMDVFNDVSGMSANFMEERNDIMVFGGAVKRAARSDLYAVNVESYQVKRIVTTGTPPSPRYRHMSVSRGKSIFVCGGVPSLHERLFPMDIFVLTSVRVTKLQWSEVDLNGIVKPEPHESSSLVRMGDKFILFGGYSRSEGKQHV